MLLTLLTLITSVSSELITTNLLWNMNGNVKGKPYYRSEWAKNITIEYEDTKILSIEGIIIPIHTSDWRPNDNCDPYNSCFINTGEPGCKGGTTIEDGYDRGHIMALSNGGPNIQLNVIAQPSNWQGSGEWRKLEKEIQRVALDKYGEDYPIYLYDVFNSTKPDNIVSWKINLNYKETCGNDNDSCNCEPESYNGFIKINNKKHYVFEIINNGTYTLNPIEKIPNDEESSLIPWIFVFIVLSIWICVYFFYRRNIQHNQISEMENSIDLEIQLN